MIKTINRKWNTDKKNCYYNIENYRRVSEKTSASDSVVEVRTKTEKSFKATLAKIQSNKKRKQNEKWKFSNKNKDRDFKKRGTTFTS